ncbi:MAG: hypothetical protein WAM42_07890 [Candidatus Nitrosopolaris sp.]|jgi:hypothetical protein
MHNKRTIERIATIALAAFLVGYFCCQVAYGTNESSYKYGFNTAIDNLTNLITVPPSWNTQVPNICDTQDGCPGSDDAQNYCLTGQVAKVTNSTACIDGYVNGWRHWCTEDSYKNAEYCTDLVFGGTASTFPGLLINEDNAIMATIPLRSMLINGTWNFVNESKSSMDDMNSMTRTSGPNVNQTTMDNMFSMMQLPMSNMDNITGLSGKIKFYWDQFQIRLANDTNPAYTSNPGWSTDGHTLTLDGITPPIHPKTGPAYFASIVLTLTKISPNQIELLDSHGDTIDLTRNG